MKNKVWMPLVVLVMLLSLSWIASSQEAKTNMTFFITSVGSGKGADLGGLAGADKHCQALAQAVGAGNHTWHAYLSTSAADGKPAVNARDRIGKGPWQNTKSSSRKTSTICTATTIRSTRKTPSARKALSPTAARSRGVKT